MPLILADRVRDTTTTTGTGTVTLSGTAPTGYQNFSVIGNGNTTYYTINAGSQWEVGIGTYSSTGPTLARNTVLESSNANALVDFAAGTKDVFVTYPSDEAVYQDGATIAAGTAILGVTNGGTGVNTSTGSGSVVLSNSPTLVTPTLGAASATSIANGLGAVGTPSYTFTGDLNTGMWSPAADTIAFSEGGVEAMRLDASGNVGIGTSNPLRRLDIAGGGFAFTESGGAARNIHWGDTTNIYPVTITGDARSGSGFLSFNTNTFGNTAVERMRIDGSGNVGIGTSSPVDRLNVSDGTANIQLKPIGGSSIGYVGLRSNHALGFTTNDTERMRIDISGNLGIGISSPSYRLDVAAGTVGTTAGNSLSLGRFSGGAGGNTVGLQTTLQRLSNGTDWTTTALRVQAQVDLSPFGYIDFLNGSTAAMTFGRATSEFMRITDTGNVGIGTNAPSTRLDVRTGAGADCLVASRGGNAAYFILQGTSFSNFNALQSYDGSNNLQWSVGAPGAANTLAFFTNGSTERMRITDAGRVGIGTSSPIQIFQVSTVGQSIDGPFFASSTGPWMRFIPNSSPGAYNNIVAAGTNAFIFSSGSANAGTLTIAPWADATGGVVINASGNVGIGTNSPTFICHVQQNNAANIGLRMRQLSTTQFAGAGLMCNGPVGTGAQGGTGFFHFNLNTGGTEGAAAIAQFDENGSFQRTLAQYSYPSQSWSFFTNGSERVRINSGGDFLIGTTSGGRTVCINSADNWIRQSNPSRSWLAGMGTGSNYIIWDETGGGPRLTVGPGGEVIASGDMRAPIYYDSADTFFYLNLNGYSQVNGFGSVNGSAGVGMSIMGNVSNGAIMSFHRSAAFAVNMGLDTDNVIRIGGWSAGANRLQMDMSGNLTMAGNVTAFSDVRLKKDIETIDGALDLVSRMRGVRFTRIENDERNVGVVAQEMLEVLPEVVQQGVGDDDTLSVAYGNIVGVLIEAIKELTTRVAELEGR